MSRSSLVWLLVAHALACGNCCHGLAQTVSFSEQTIHRFQAEQIRGGALRPASGRDQPALIAWGDRLLAWALPRGEIQVLADQAGFSEGGCLVDINRDGRLDLVAQQGNQMIWLEAPRWRRRLIDTDADFHECIPATLHGRRGVLLVHRRMQVRFYEIPSRLERAWRYREIYSIYTPSHQAGLAMLDVDGDGFQDIFCGNYWIRSPARFDLPWRLFAINSWWEAPQSAMLRLALARISGSAFPDLIAVQAEMGGARLAWFRRPSEPTQFWTQHRLEGALDLQFPHAMAIADFDGDGRDDLVLGENNGPQSRLFFFHNGRGSSLIGRTSGLIQAWTVDLDLLTLGPTSVSWWRNQRRR